MRLSRYTRWLYGEEIGQRQRREVRQGRQVLSRRAFLGRLAGACAAVVAVPVLLEALPADPLVTVSAPEVLSFRVGDVVTIADRQSLNPLTMSPTGYLQTFVVTQSATAEDIAAWPMVLYPRLIDYGPYANVSSAAPFLACDVKRWTPKSVRVRVPQRYTVSNGRAYQPQAVGEFYDVRLLEAAH